ncbi:MAG: hypothetical protein KIT84_32420 [Labilithrix sp.]|nr:hypothetical protein [Labilithrix sp.]MCW5815779.1 hypothetical protein [Labilithrix sp.]
MKEPHVTETETEGELLPAELCWAEGDHASDVVLTALADGQHAIVPAAVRAHVARCTTCIAHLGHSALLSLETQRSLAATRQAEGRRPVPRLAVALGLVAAAVGLVPWLLTHDAPERPARALSAMTRALAAVAARLDAGGASMIGIVATYVAAACLVFMGLGLARLSPKKEVSR